jgi:WhiB family transcriptional regulator, redox-sensing transcriptional regulator
MDLPGLVAEGELFPGADEGLCRGFPLRVFFPSGEDEDGRRDYGQGIYLWPLSICRVCPVRTPCREYAVARPERFGVWGGTTPRQRRELRAD